MISTDGKTEPRLQCFGERTWQAQQIFGVDADALQPEQPVVIDGSVLGFPMKSLNEIRSDDYFVQAILNRYTTFHRSDGYTVKLPRDEGEGQKWSRKPGNLYSEPMKVHIDPEAGGTIRVRMTRVLPRIDRQRIRKYVKHIRALSLVSGSPLRSDTSMAPVRRRGSKYSGRLSSFPGILDFGPDDSRCSGINFDGDLRRHTVQPCLRPYVVRFSWSAQSVERAKPFYLMANGLLLVSGIIGSISSPVPNRPSNRLP